MPQAEKNGSTSQMCPSGLDRATPKPKGDTPCRPSVATALWPGPGHTATAQALQNAAQHDSHAPDDGDPGHEPKGRSGDSHHPQASQQGRPSPNDKEGADGGWGWG